MCSNIIVIIIENPKNIKEYSNGPESFYHFPDIKKPQSYIILILCLIIVNNIIIIHIIGDILSDKIIISPMLDMIEVTKNKSIHYF